MQTFITSNLTKTPLLLIFLKNRTKITDLKIKILNFEE